MRLLRGFVFSSASSRYFSDQLLWYWKLCMRLAARAPVRFGVRAPNFALMLSCILHRSPRSLPDGKSAQASQTSEVPRRAEPYRPASGMPSTPSHPRCTMRVRAPAAVRSRLVLCCQTLVSLTLARAMLAITGLSGTLISRQRRRWIGDGALFLSRLTPPPARRAPRAPWLQDRGGDRACRAGA